MFYLVFVLYVLVFERFFLFVGLRNLDACTLFSSSPLRNAPLDFYISGAHTLSSFFFSSYVVFSTILAALKLITIWFVVVWLRMNLVRYRFDQVASLTWHELVVLGVCLLVQVVLLVWVL